MGWGSGTAEFPYLIDPLSAISSHAAADGTTVKTSISDSDLAAAATAAAGVEVAIVFVSADSGEAFITGASISAWVTIVCLFEIDDFSRRQCWGSQ